MSDSDRRPNFDEQHQSLLADVRELNRLDCLAPKTDAEAEARRLAMGRILLRLPVRVLKLGAAHDREVAEATAFATRDALDAADDAAESRPTVVCLIGSTRFRREYEGTFRAEEHAGRICLTVPCYKDDPCCKSPADHARLDELHRRKIDLFDAGRFLP